MKKEIAGNAEIAVEKPEPKQKRRGLHVDFYRGKFGSPLTLCEKYKSAILYGEGIPEIFEESDECPALRLERRHLADRGDENDYYWTAYPDFSPKGYYCFGGSFIYSPDSRFPSRYPIPVHDRDEG